MHTTHSPPLALSRLDFSLVEFNLEFQESFDMDLARMLRLRRDLRSAAQLALEDTESYAALFDPPLSSDPVAVRRYQRPGPSFVIHPNPAHCGHYDVGDQLPLTVLFWGRGVQFLLDFARSLQALGSSGFNRGEGCFDLLAIAARNPVGDWVPLWDGKGFPTAVAPPVLSVDWWRENLPPCGEHAILEFVTPARLLSQGRPLFHADFARVFPFILRRVSSMIYAHCGFEIVDDPIPWQQAAQRVRVECNELVWQDWRTLDAQAGPQDIGGISGRLSLRGEGLVELEWLLRVGSLLNLGKGAAYGAGYFKIDF